MSDPRFSMVDVFSEETFRGNPLAVWHVDGEEPSDEECQAFARWTNLSETTILLPATDPGADYRVRIFTTVEELPFAGHPTLGSCAAWLAAGGVPADPTTIVQQCGAGLVRVRRDGDRLGFAAPPLTRAGRPDDATLDAVCRALGLAPEDIVDASWVVNGPVWLGVLLRDAQTVVNLKAPAPQALDGFELGVIGPHAPGGPADYEVRAFCPEIGVGEDPVTGSLNAGLGQWLIGAGLAPSRYTVAQGTALQRSGRLTVSQEGDDLWVSGCAPVRVTGRLAR